MKEDIKVQSAKTIFLLTVLFGLVLGCNGQKKVTVEANKEETTSDSPLTLVAQGNYAPTDSAETQVVRSEKDLSVFFRKINMTRKPGIPIPKVDFSKDMVIIYCAGTNGNGMQPSLVVAEENDAEFILVLGTIKGNENLLQM